MNLPPPSEYDRFFLDLCRIGHFIVACKIITLGEGPICYHQGLFNRPDWILENIYRFNTTTQTWFRRAIPLLVKGTNYINASPGMLMGMHNALSTTVGLATCMHRQDPQHDYVTTLRSSDDSMTLYLSDNPQRLGSILEIDRKSLKLLGINLSPSKSIVFNQDYGEYSSWYQDGNFVSQYGVETSTLRPQGKNPMDDFHTIAKSTSVSQQRLEMNPFGAEMKIRVGVDNCRRL